MESPAPRFSQNHDRSLRRRTRSGVRLRGTGEPKWAPARPTPIARLAISCVAGSCLAHTPFGLARFAISCVANNSFAIACFATTCVAITCVAVTRVALTRVAITGVAITGVATAERVHGRRRLQLRSRPLRRGARSGRVTRVRLLPRHLRAAPVGPADLAASL